jgi:hypothetical protein
VEASLAGKCMSEPPEHRGIRGGRLRGTLVVSRSNPPNFFDDHAVANLIRACIERGPLPPSAVGSSTSDTASEHSFLYHAELHLRPLDLDITVRARYASAINDGILDGVTQIVSRELVDAVTDPEGGWFTGDLETCSVSRWCGIGDLCEGVTGRVTASRGTFWLNQAQQCILPPDQPDDQPDIREARSSGKGGDNVARSRPGRRPAGTALRRSPARPDEDSFQQSETSAAYCKSPYYLLQKSQLQPVPAPRLEVPRVDLGDVLGADLINPIQKAKKISFHAVGDTGEAKVNQFQTAARAIANEASVADSMAQDVAQGGPTGPAFFFHLGDAVYNFGEGQYYYDEFYEPFRACDRPIFAIPGNHDGMVFGAASDVPQVATLAAFLRNFCADHPGPSPDSGGLVRSTMNQPGVYFTLDAPLLSVIGLYTNVLEGPRVIGPGKLPSGQPAYPSMNTAQTDFLAAELQRLKPLRQAGQRAVIIACHHPPASVDAKHGAYDGLANDIDAACAKAGSGPMRCSPATPISTRALRVRSAIGRFPTWLPAATAMPPHIRSAVYRLRHRPGASTRWSPSRSSSSDTCSLPST